jgi:hypothetical protein
MSCHFRHRVGDVKRGVLQAGGFPVELPAISLSESTVKPTTMLSRMETEELIRSQPRGDERRCACDLPAGRPHAAWQLARQDVGFGLGRLEILG